MTNIRTFWKTNKIMEKEIKKLECYNNYTIGVTAAERGVAIKYCRNQMANKLAIIVLKH